MNIHQLYVISWNACWKVVYYWKHNRRLKQVPLNGFN